MTEQDVYIGHLATLLRQAEYALEVRGNDDGYYHDGYIDALVDISQLLGVKARVRHKADQLVFEPEYECFVEPT